MWLHSKLGKGCEVANANSGSGNWCWRGIGGRVWTGVAELRVTPTNGHETWWRAWGEGSE
jgi:hypothetical protein